MDWTLVLVGLALGAVVGWVIARLFTEKVMPPVAPPAPRPQPPVVSDPPELAWIARGNTALGVWLRRSARGNVVGVTDPAVPEAVKNAIAGRLATMAAASVGRTEVERIEEGVIVYIASDDVQLAILLPPKQPFVQAQRDLEGFVGLLRTREMLELASQKPAGSGETVSSVAIRLAMEIEQILDAEVAVAVRRPRGAQVIGASVRADPHLHRVIAVPGSAVDLAVNGEINGMVMAYDPLGVLPPDRRLRERRAFVTPILSRGGQLGAVVVWPPSGLEPTGPARVELEQALRRAGPRFEDAMQRLDLVEQAVRDPLTGLRNRRGMTEAMGAIETERGTLICFDLDRFKSLNDTLGHPAGDAALQTVAGILEELVRDGDTAARVGGEEFAVWLPEATLEEGLAVAERIRFRIETAQWEWQGRHWPMAASFGVASWPETTRHRDNLLAQADAALYKAKEHGRNRVEKAVKA
ncbi:MAG TPA: GGDEF domain-containing protein [Gemmatimonadales bacterium]